MSQRFAVVHEAEADFTISTELADRVLMDAIEWLEESHLFDQREWVAAEPSGHRLTWKAVKRLAREAGVRSHGHFDGEPGLADAAAARRAILYLLFAIPDLSAILLIRDQDDQPERRHGLEQARGSDQSGVAIVLGLAVVERECWVIAGFEPGNEDEASRLDEERRTLGFDPRSRGHDLTACKDDQAQHSPKRVLRHLSEGDRERERRCWMEAPLALLIERGASNGLADYLGDVREKLAPLIGHAGR